MFQVQRFTADEEEQEGDHDSTSILNNLLQRAKSRAIAKRARLEHATGTNSGNVPEDGAHVSPGTTVKKKYRSARAVESSRVVSADSRASSVAEAKPEGLGLPKGRSPTGPQGRIESSSFEAAKAMEDAEGAKESQSSEEDEERDEEEEENEEDEEDEDVDMQASHPAEGSADGEDQGGQGLRPMEEVAEEWGLDARLAKTLREEGVKHFFPIQVKVVPDIVATERHSHVQSRDICVSAPTGSGKTLVFVLGLLQALIRRRVVRLRALVVLPSRDLAMQVHAVFQRYARDTGLRVGLAIGQTNFLEEQLALVGAAALAGNPVATARATSMRGHDHHTRPDPTGDIVTDWGGGLGGSMPAGGVSEPCDVLASTLMLENKRGILRMELLGESFKVDIVVATPGRLLDHLEQTPGFTLQHLRYLVIDEADRLLNQSYQNWVAKVIKAAYRREPGTAAPLSDEDVNKGRTRGHDIAGSERSGSKSGDGPGVRHRHCPPPGVRLDPVTVRGRPLATGDRVRGATVSTPPLRKLLFSATLTNNPQKLARLDVVNPLIYTAREMTPAVGRARSSRGGKAVRGSEDGGGENDAKRPSQETRRSNLDEIGVDATGKGRFSTPATLEETYTVCDSPAKPLVLLSLLQEMVGRQKELSVVFTSSVDSTHRLFRLLQLFGGFEGTSAREGGGEGVGGDTDADSDGGVAEFSSSLGQRQRSHIIRRARMGAIRVIVCSDGMARGMDLDGVGLVVNYDVPSHAKTYVHRVGRTARAGLRGAAVTIAKKGQVKQFLKMRASVDGKKVRLDSSPADQSRLLLLAGRYQRCLQDLKEVLEAEKTGELDPTAPVTAVDDVESVER